MMLSYLCERITLPKHAKTLAHLFGVDVRVVVNVDGRYILGPNGSVKEYTLQKKMLKLLVFPTTAWEIDTPTLVVAETGTISVQSVGVSFTGYMVSTVNHERRFTNICI